MPSVQQKGIFYERKAESFLRLKGYRILERNFRARFGEIDIIAKDRKILTFVEVKARDRNYWVSPSEAIDEEKKRKIVKTAKSYLLKKRREEDCRFDVVSIIEGEGWREYRLIQDAFSA